MAGSPTFPSQDSGGEELSPRAGVGDGGGRRLQLRDLGTALTPWGRGVKHYQMLSTLSPPWNPPQVGSLAPSAVEGLLGRCLGL